MLAELGDAFAVVGDVQFLPGYALALTKKPGVDRLSDLPRSDRVRFLADVDVVATAVENVCSVRDAAYRRVNVEILGNTDAFLHAHVWPRYGWEADGVVGRPVWLYPLERWRALRPPSDHSMTTCARRWFGSLTGSAGDCANNDHAYSSPDAVAIRFNV